MVLKSDQVNLNRLYKSIDASACLSKWHELVSGPSDIGQDFWLGVATQAMVAAMHQHHNCPAGSIYVQKKPAVKVVVASAPSEKFVLTPYPAVVKKGEGYQPHPSDDRNDAACRLQPREARHEPFAHDRILEDASRLGQRSCKHGDFDGRR